MKNNKVPEFLLDKKYMLESVLFITVFSFVFMAIYTPFSSTSWFDITSLKGFMMTMSFYIVGVAILIVSKYTMYWAKGKTVITKRKYIGWLTAEVVLIALFYVFFTTSFVFTNHKLFFPILLRASYCVTMILAIPYTIATLYAVYEAKREEVDMLRNAHIEEVGASDNQLINFYDNNGILRLSVNIDSLYYAESQDNYVKIYYESESKLHNYMLRCKTKTIEESFAGTPLIRCHRSYIVNTLKIKVLKNERNSAYVVLDHPNIKPVPVSKSYYDNFINAVAGAANNAA